MLPPVNRSGSDFMILRGRLLGRARSRCPRRYSRACRPWKANWPPPTFEPRPDARAKIPRALGIEALRQIPRTALQVRLTRFNHGKQFVAFSLPGCFIRFMSHPLGQKI